MIIIIQKRLKTYINKDQVRTIVFNEDKKEAIVSHIDGSVIKYVNVEELKL